MNMRFFIRTKTRTSLKVLFFVLVFVFAFSIRASAQKISAAQTKAPKVTQIDEIKLKSLIKPNGRPLLVSFWATWCVPCVEEFPDLVKIDADYKGKIDFITVSLDDLAEINRDVPKFLSNMKAEMPAYLLKSTNEDAAILSVSKNWQGGLPFTILFDEKGESIYFKQGKVKIEDLRAALEKLVKTDAPKDAPKSAETKASPKVSSIDENNLSKIIRASKEKKQPLLIKFWATWCRPCREEFPGLVAVYNEFQPKGVEFITVSTDSSSESKKIPPFLQEMNAAMPAFHLQVKNKYTMFSLMPFWTGGVPFLVLYDAAGRVSYAKTGLVDAQILKSEIEHVLSPATIR
jgi:thiol-disulfide isomerase/thioredoxin